MGTRQPAAKKRGATQSALGPARIRPKRQGASSRPAVSAAKLEVRAVTHETWGDFERLFESQGAPNYCWCMAWRATREELKNASRAARKQQIAQRVKAGTPVGLLAYLAGEPVGWCSVAPRSTFRGLVKDGSDDAGVWSVTCFFVRRDHRRTQLSHALLRAAIRHAKQQGARVVEGYAVDADSPSYRHMGFVPLFEHAGFTEVGRVGTRRHVMRRRAR